MTLQLVDAETNKLKDSEVEPLEAEIPSALACPEGDIFSLPTKDEIVNAFNEMAAVFLDENLPENVFGAPKAGSGNWASCIRIMDPIRGKSVQKIKLDQNDAAMR